MVDIVIMQDRLTKQSQKKSRKQIYLIIVSPDTWSLISKTRDSGIVLHVCARVATKQGQPHRNVIGQKRHELVLIDYSDCAACLL